MTELKNSAGQLINKDIATVFEQTQVAYVTLSAIPDKACANCIFFRDTGYDGIEYQHCSIVSAYPDPILPTGYCNHWESKPVASNEMAEEIAETVTDAVVNAVETIAENMPMVQMEMAAKPKTLLQRAKEVFFPEKEPGAFNVFKGIDGKWYWVARYTNAYEDKEGEIFTEKAHEAFITRLDMKLVDMPELWSWHTKGTKHGQADTIFGVGRVMVAIGHFDDSTLAKNAINFYQKNADKIKLSHGALAPKWAVHDGLIEAYNTFEISTLPIGAESNPYTSYEVIKTMQPNPEKVKWGEKLFGKDNMEQIISGSAELSKGVEDMMVRYKDFAQADTPTSQSNEAQQNMGDVFVEMVKEQGQLFTVLQAMEKRQDATDTLVKSLKATNEAYEKEVAELRKAVNAPPRRPSQDGSTIETDPAVITKAQEILSNEADDFKNRWGVPMKTNGNGSNS